MPKDYLLEIRKR
ncbi:d695375f-ba97-41d9-a4d6-311976db2130 [Thermothielavioides terrestris]|uniref:D695375f-ba97-41d9-a4d6-311976db2130 n=1 Tax=Thermothielavioides terrestris TaxID=2587410 RepID=A0A446BBL4_9PEZI|nr:d695375f-ba97-41d9-a4d6-311976db2130 [Thermothielavioides terrestris]